MSLNGAWEVFVGSREMELARQFKRASSLYAPALMPDTFGNPPRWKCPYCRGTETVEKVRCTHCGAPRP